MRPGFPPDRISESSCQKVIEDAGYFYALERGDRGVGPAFWSTGKRDRRDVAGHMERQEKTQIDFSVAFCAVGDGSGVARNTTRDQVEYRGILAVVQAGCTTPNL